MKKTPGNTESGTPQAAELRRRAEEAFHKKAEQAQENVEALSPEEILRVLHELRVHQIELEMQNEELRTAQAEIKAGRARYFDLYDLAPVGYCTVSEKNLILEANLTAATLLGTARGALVKQPISGFILKDDQDIYYLHRKKLFETGQPQECELRLVKPDGEIIWAHLTATAAQAENGAPVCRVVLSDITERKRADESLREERERLESVLTATRTGIDIIDGEFNLHFVDKSWQKVYGDPTGRKCYEYFNGLSEPCPGCGIPQALATKQVVITEEVLPRENNRPIEVCIFPFQNAEGQWLVAEVNIDITERKRIEKKTQKLQAQLTQAQKMESVGRLAGGVAHDFNNMLGVILGYTELALERVGPAGPLFDDLEEIRNAAQRSADLTRQLLAFARKQTIVPKALDLNDTVEGMLNMLRRLIGEDINLAWKPGRELWPVKMDPTQIDQMLANLCVNSRDAIAGVGRISVDTRNTDVDEAYCAQQADVTPGEYVTLTVSDDGCGMDSKTLLLLFEPFFTTKETGKGTGLGLATVYGIVRQNNGFINVYSEPGQGTTFNIYLPRHTAKTEPPPKQVPVQAPMRGHETILLVEDEPAILKMTTIMLERQGYTVVAAGTPDEAVRLAGENAGRIDLLITDVVMPEMNGRDLAKNLLSACPSLKCLFMSGYTADVIAHHGVLDEGEHFIQKPFSMKDLGEKLRGVLKG